MFSSSSRSFLFLLIALSLAYALTTRPPKSPGSLQKAVEVGDLTAIEGFLSAKKKINIDPVDDDHNTPLSNAARLGRFEIAAELIAAGAAINHINYKGQSPVWLAAREGHVDIVKALLKAGAYPAYMDGNKETTLHVAAQGGYLDIVKALVKKGHPVNVMTKDGKSPLSHAIANSHAAVAKWLSENGGVATAEEKSQLEALLKSKK